MQVTSVEFVELSASEAQCLLNSSEGVVSLNCVSLLPNEADSSQHRIAWLQDALRQLRRMPEYRAAASQTAFSNVVLSADKAVQRVRTQP